MTNKQYSRESVQYVSATHNSTLSKGEQSSPGTLIFYSTYVLLFNFISGQTLKS